MIMMNDRQLADVITIYLKLAIPNCFAVAESVVYESMAPLEGEL